MARTANLHDSMVPHPTLLQSDCHRSRTPSEPTFSLDAAGRVLGAHHLPMIVVLGRFLPLPYDPLDPLLRPVTLLKCILFGASTASPNGRGPEIILQPLSPNMLAPVLCL